MKQHKKSNILLKPLIIFCLIIITTTLTGCSLFKKNYEKKLYFLVNSSQSFEIVIPSNEELENTLYLFIISNVIYFWENDKIEKTYKIRIVDGKIMFLDSSIYD